MTRACYLLVLCAVGCDAQPAAAPTAAAAPPPAADRSAAARIAVAPGADLQARIDAAPAGAVIELLPGEHRGPVRIDRGITVRGPRAAVVASAGTGSTVHLVGDGAGLVGCTVRGSGTRFDLLDSAVRVEGRGATVRGVEVRDALFGILVQLSSRVELRDNLVVGTGQAAMGLRGDGIRLWETTDALVQGNVVRDCRDLVVWYSSRNRILDNDVSGGRYGTHFMYGHDNVVEGNHYRDCVVGVFVMYSHDIDLRHNLMVNAGGAAGIGLGVKESGNLRITENWFVGDTTGIYLDTSPLDLSHRNRIEGNVVRLCATALSFHASAERNDCTGNLFADNGALVQVGGQGNALACAFAGNYYDDYCGFDLDGDGFGDVPFELRRLSSHLESRAPELLLLRGSPAMLLTDMVGEVLPLFTPQPLLRDDRPLLRAPTPAWHPTETDHAP